MEIIMKRCGNCGDEKPLKSFSKDKWAKDGHRFYCKKCISRIQKKRHLSKQANKRNNLKHLYGITLEQYNQLFNEQRGICAICGIPARDLKCALAVDHNHKTGEIRGLLCSACNFLLGRIEKNPQLIPIIMKYLKAQR